MIVMTRKQMESALRKRPSIFPSRLVATPRGPLMATMSIELTNALQSDNDRRVGRLNLTIGERAARRLQLRRELGK